MKKWVALCAVLAAMVIVSPSQAAEPEGQIDSGALAGLGLSGMQQMSDDEGTQVRGRYAETSGFSTASVRGGARTINRHYAEGNFFAVSGSGSAARRVTTNITQTRFGTVRQTRSVTVFAAGFAFGGAF